MTKYCVKADPSLNIDTKAFGARIENTNVLIPSKLAQSLKHLSLGDDATTLAGFLASFPMSVAGSLGLSPDAVVKAVNSFIDLLEESGADVSSVRRHMPRLPRGARHPRQMES